MKLDVFAAVVDGRDHECSATLFVLERGSFVGSFRV